MSTKVSTLLAATIAGLSPGLQKYGSEGPVDGLLNMREVLNQFPPQIDSITPNTGVAAGGDAVVIRGSGFRTATGGKTDVNGLTTFVVVSDTEITGVTAADSRSTAGVVPVNVSVTNQTGTGYLLEGFTYTP